jgi:hypothetical protein
VAGSKVFDASFSPTGQTVAVATEYYTNGNLKDVVRIYATKRHGNHEPGDEIDPGNEMRDGWGRRVSFSPDGLLAMCCKPNGNSNLVRVMDGSKSVDIKYDSPETLTYAQISWSSMLDFDDAERLAVAANDEVALLRMGNDPQVWGTVQSPSGNLFHAALEPVHGENIAAGGSAGLVYMFGAPKYDLFQQYPTFERYRVTALEWMDETSFVYGDDAGGFRFYNLASRGNLCEVRDGGYVSDVAAVYDDPRLQPRRWPLVAVVSTNNDEGTARVLLFDSLARISGQPTTRPTRA